LIKDIPLLITTDNKWDTVNKGEQAFAAPALDVNIYVGQGEAEKQV
jgi:hypothetical protein